MDFIKCADGAKDVALKECNFGICKGIKLKISLLQIFFPSTAQLVGITFSGYLKTKTIKTETTGRPDKNYLKVK